MLEYNESTMKVYERIKEKFKNIPDIPAELVPADSVFKEFIG
jgi:hypothetical protein